MRNRAAAAHQSGITGFQSSLACELMHPVEKTCAESLNGQLVCSFQCNQCEN